MNKEQENQNASAEEGSENSQEQEALGKLNETSIDGSKGEESTEAKEEKTELQDSEKEEKKEKDFEKATYKFRELYKQEKAKNEELLKVKETPQTTELTPEELIAQAGDDEKKGINLLQHIISKEVSKIAKPLEAQREEIVLKEFEEKQYVKELAPQIQSKLNNQPDYLKSQALEVRLEQARRDAIAENLDVITKAAVSVGEDKGYQSRELKEKQGGLKEQPNRTEGKDDFFKRLETGDVSDEEYKERYDEVQQYHKEQLSSLK